MFDARPEGTFAMVLDLDRQHSAKQLPVPVRHARYGDDIIRCTSHQHVLLLYYCMGRVSVRITE